MDATTNKKPIETKLESEIESALENLKSCILDHDYNKVISMLSSTFVKVYLQDNDHDIKEAVVLFDLIHAISEYGKAEYDLMFYQNEQNQLTEKQHN